MRALKSKRFPIKTANTLTMRNVCNDVLRGMVNAAKRIPPSIAVSEIATVIEREICTIGYSTPL